MKVFIAGTDTDIGKTTIASWLCLHTGYDYFKPIQTGSIQGTDSITVKALAPNFIHPEIYCYPEPCSPHLAAAKAKQVIKNDAIIVPKTNRLIIEGAGGLLVPLNSTTLFIDLIKQWNFPVILVASTRLGTINHTLLSIEALKTRAIPILGIIMNGITNQENCDAIYTYSGVPILMQFPWLSQINRNTLASVPLPLTLSSIFNRC